MATKGKPQCPKCRVGKMYVRTEPLHGKVLKCRTCGHTITAR